MSPSIYTRFKFARRSRSSMAYLGIYFGEGGGRAVQIIIGKVDKALC